MATPELCTSCGDDEAPSATESCVSCNQALCPPCYEHEGGWCNACIRREEGDDRREADPDAAYDRWRDDGDGPLPMAARLAHWRMQ